MKHSAFDEEADIHQHVAWWHNQDPADQYQFAAVLNSIWVHKTGINKAPNQKTGKKCTQPKTFKPNYEKFACFKCKQFGHWRKECPLTSQGKGGTACAGITEDNFEAD